VTMPNVSSQFRLLDSVRSATLPVDGASVGCPRAALPMHRQLRRIGIGKPLIVLLGSA
jgi:hypothetical protein